MRTVWIVLLAAIAFLGAPAFAGAQAAEDGANVALELGGGYAAFVDESLINHGVMTGALRMRVWRRVSIGPELTYMIGPGDDRDLFVTGNVFVDLRSQSAGHSVMPYLVGAGGLMRHSDRIGPLGFSSNEPAASGGIGARIRLTDRMYVAPEFRIGSELHCRTTAVVGIELP